MAPEEPLRSPRESVGDHRPPESYAYRADKLAEYEIVDGPILNAIPSNDGTEGLGWYSPQLMSQDEAKPLTESGGGKSGTLTERDFA